jgi:hypothetical protein
MAKKLCYHTSRSDQDGVPVGSRDPDYLGRIGVLVVNELRGLGQNMQDDPIAAPSLSRRATRQ